MGKALRAEEAACADAWPQVVGLGIYRCFLAAADSAVIVEMAEEFGDGNQGTDLRGLTSSQWGSN